MKVKICGITNLEDAYEAVFAGAWALGFMFYPQSVRALSPEQAREIIRELPTEVEKVGVFVNASVEEIGMAAHVAGLTIVQLHGNEPVETCARLQQLGLRVIKAFRPIVAEDIATMQAYQGLVEAFLVDAAVHGAWGGTGKQADWGLAQQAHHLGPLILAGGLTPNNVAEAVNAVGPMALDLSSGVESGPGRKNAEKLRQLFAALERIAA